MYESWYNYQRGIKDAAKKVMKRYVHACEPNVHTLKKPDFELWQSVTTFTGGSLHLMERYHILGQELISQY